MTFYGKDSEPKSTQRVKTYKFLTDRNEKVHEIKAHDVYFYESGHVGFWSDTDDGDRTLIRAVKALDVWEEAE